MLYGAAYAKAMAEQPWHGARARGSACKSSQRKPPRSVIVDLPKLLTAPGPRIQIVKHFAVTEGVDHPPLQDGDRPVPRAVKEANG